MIGAAFWLQQQGPVGHYAGGASSKIAGTTAFAGKIARFLLSSVPQWIQIAGVVIGVPVAIIVVWQLWKRRRAVWAWWVARRTAIRVAIIGVFFVVAAGAATSGLATYTYIMHDNDFCQSCHVMDTAWNRFQVSAHKGLQCHACHRQPLYVSSVELFYWVGERKMEVPVHDKVPTAVCSECHSQKGTDSTLTNIALTAGHAVHLKSDSAALKDVQCVSCHGRDFHIFVPSNESCSQSGCHTVMKVNLGAMSNQSFRHCTICHDFKSRVPLSVTVAEAKKKLYPQAMNCESCHAMTQRLLSFDLAADPHKGNCGICHNPHKQTEPKNAFKTCAESQCHGSPDTLTAFHRGLAGHAMQQCGQCHQAHSWKVKGTDCLTCHKNINQDRPIRRVGSIFRPASNAAARPRNATPFVFASFFREGAGHGPAVQPGGQPARQPDTTFRHSRHTSVTCTTCHGTTSTHGGLKFARPAGCLACHHGPEQKANCTTCHATSTLGVYTQPMAFAISARPAAVTRTMAFAHERHGTIACATCHGADAKRALTTTCASCHANHHTPTANCAGCHTTAATMTVAHNRTVHDGCAKCHTDPTVAALPATRPVCLACHTAQREHYPTRDCATCHALADRAMMRTVGGAGGSR